MFYFTRGKMTQQMLKFDVMRMLIIAKRRIYPSQSDISRTYQISVIEELRSFNGNKLIFTIEEQRELAFKQLEKYWI
uniref:Uncharacterized protein n=1 Tax=Panagrolaimus sp. ES5 TaxID=591445 RepID=A0AC34F2M5_9BILA